MMSCAAMSNTSTGSGAPSSCSVRSSASIPLGKQPSSTCSTRDSRRSPSGGHCGRGESEDEEVVCIQEANPTTVTVARGYYSMPGVPTLTITAQQLASGEWVMRR